jgi:hypothetical protein
MQFMTDGGWSMWIVLIFGLAALLCGGALSIRPTPGKLALLRGLTLATVFAVLSGVGANLSTTFRYASGVAEVERGAVVLQGMAESLAPTILGFTMLALAWLAGATGMRRL